MSTNLYAALESGSTDPTTRRAMRVLSQLSDDDLAALDSATGALGSSIRNSLKNYRRSAGRGSALMRIVDVDHLRFTEEEFRTYAFGMFLAASIALGNSFTLKELYSAAGTTNPSGVDWQDDVPESLRAKATTAFTTVDTNFKLNIATVALETDVPTSTVKRLTLGLANTLGITLVAARKAVFAALASMDAVLPNEDAFKAARPGYFSAMRKFYFLLAREVQGLTPFEATETFINDALTLETRRWMASVHESGGPSADDEDLATSIASGRLTNRLSETFTASEYGPDVAERARSCSVRAQKLGRTLANGIHAIIAECVHRDSEEVVPPNVDEDEPDGETGGKRRGSSRYSRFNQPPPFDQPAERRVVQRLRNQADRVEEATEDLIAAGQDAVDSLLMSDPGVAPYYGGRGMDPEFFDDEEY